MQVLFNDRFYYSPRMDTKAACHLKVLTANSSVLIIVTEVEDNLGWSIAKSPETLATQIINLLQLNPDRVQYIEHYMPQEVKKLDQKEALVRSIEAYFLVSFIWRTMNGALPPYKAIRPQRQSLSVVNFVRLMRNTIYAHHQNIN